MSAKPDRPCVEETAATWEAPGEPLRPRPRVGDFSLEQAAEETLGRYPVVMARLAE